jgi:hypothetical protein
MLNFEHISYLEYGNDRQKSAYQTLVKHQIFEKIKTFDPILTGTIPINIDLPESDLDIICYWKDKAEFIKQLKISFSKESNFNIKEIIINEQESVIAHFWIDDFEVEIFGQQIPTKSQNAFKHMLIEHQILQKKGEEFRQQVIELKKQGIKTEPAFAKLLGLAGNPYISFLNHQLHDF